MAGLARIAIRVACTGNGKGRVPWRAERVIAPIGGAKTSTAWRAIIVATIFCRPALSQIKSPVCSAIRKSTATLNAQRPCTSNKNGPWPCSTWRNRIRTAARLQPTRDSFRGTGCPGYTSWAVEAKALQRDYSVITHYRYLLGAFTGICSMAKFNAPVELWDCLKFRYCALCGLGAAIGPLLIPPNIEGSACF